MTPSATTSWACFISVASQTYPKPVPTSPALPCMLQVCDHPSLSELAERSPPQHAAEAVAEGGEGGSVPAAEPAALPLEAAAPPGTAAGVGGGTAEEEDGKLTLDKLLSGSAKLAMLDRMLQVGLQVAAGVAWLADCACMVFALA